jgi:hypothetical protein
MYGQLKLLSASALRFKGKFVVRLGRIKRFTNIWKTVTADTVKYGETGRTIEQVVACPKIRDPVPTPESSAGSGRCHSWFLV